MRTDGESIARLGGGGAGVRVRDRDVGLTHIHAVELRVPML